MSADGHAEWVAAEPIAAPPARPRDATAEDESRRRAALRLRRLGDRQAGAGDPAGLRSTPAAILALFR